MPILTKPKGVPKCPNHGCDLEGFPFPMTMKGTATCPVSGYSFEYEVDLTGDAVKMDKDGNLIKDTEWKVTGDD